MKAVLHAIATFAVIIGAVLLVTNQVVKLDQEIDRIFHTPGSTAER